MHTDRCGNFRTQKCHGKAAEKQLKYKSIFIETQRMWNLKCDNSTRNDWINWNSKRNFIEKFRRYIKKTFNKFII